MDPLTAVMVSMAIIRMVRKAVTWASQVFLAAAGRPSAVTLTHILTPLRGRICMGPRLPCTLRQQRDERAKSGGCADQDKRVSARVT
jgi:hypothetical protein